MPDQTATRAEFCKLLGITNQQFTSMVATRRIALTDDGARVRVAQSQERIRIGRESIEALHKFPIPNTVTRAEFAVIAGFKANYTYQLQTEGRLVMAEDGKHVLVAESIARIAATRDPSKAGVAARHAAARGAAAQTGHATNQPIAPVNIAQQATENIADTEPGQEDPATGLYDFQSAKAKREHWAAEREHAQYLKEAGELMERSAVVAAFADAGAAMRASLEAWQATLPPTLVGLDEPAIRITLADQVERLLHNLVDRFSRAAAQDPAA